MPIQENLRVIADMAKHDPRAMLGFRLLGAGGVFSLRVTLRMNRARFFGVKDWSWDSNFRLPLDYWKVRKQQG
jgi:hypothetical protein